MASYFVPAVAIGFLGIMNLFVAILVEKFSSGDEQEAGGKIKDDEEAIERAAAEASLSLAPTGGEMSAANADSDAAAHMCSMLRRAAFWLANRHEFELMIQFLIVLSSCGLVLDTPRLERPSELATLLDGANVAFTAIFTAEAALKIFSYGWGPYVSSSWNLVDLSIVGTSLLSLASTWAPGLSSLRTLRILRILRPLRLLGRYPGMKVVVEALVQTLPPVLNIATLMFVLQGFFAIVGVKLFSGSFGSCTDESIHTRELCVPPNAPQAAADADAGLSGRLLRGGGSSLKGRVAGGAGVEWLNPPAGHFDSFFSANLALFVAATGDNMPDLMYRGMDAVGPGVAPVRTEWSPDVLYFLGWLLIGSFMGLNLFVGAIVDTFSDLQREADGFIMMTNEQVLWVLMMREAREAHPVRRPHPPSILKSWRMPCYRAALSQRLEYIIFGTHRCGLLISPPCSLLLGAAARSRPAAYSRARRCPIARRRRRHFPERRRHGV